MKDFKVDFMIIGAQKCGTTTVSHILADHSSVVCCDKKEPHFFSKSNNWRVELPRYENMFKKQKGVLYFEASTSYTFYPHFNLEIWNDIYNYNPQIRLIYIVRNPIERITSGYMHSYERGYTDLKFEEAVVKNSSLLDVTRYASQIKPYLDRFSRNQVHICFLEDLVTNANTFVIDLAGFLGIDPNGFSKVHEIHSNKSIGSLKLHHKYDRRLAVRVLKRVAPPVWRKFTVKSARTFQEKPVLSPPYQRMILHMLRSEIDELETLTGRDLNHWRKVKSL